MNQLQRLPVVATAALALAAGLNAPAQAQPAAPSNDRPRYAEEATGLGYTDSVDVSYSTSGRSEPTGCANSASVWYRYTPAADETINVNTSGSSYNTAIGVYTGEPGDFTQLRCVTRGPFPQVGLNLKATAGTTYFFMVGADGRQNNGLDGQDFEEQPLLLQFTMRTPLRIDPLAADDSGTVDQTDGDAHATLTHQCSPSTDWSIVSASLRQRVNETFVARSGTRRGATCGTPTSLNFQPWTDIAFGPGPATLTARMSVCSRETGTCAKRRITEEVVLAYPGAG